ncbi:PiggyBac transposable element-derived protein 3 [Trichinella pseudospiralis]|uniref:PiggyBac transposable element-derived protein 3 n=1 Tax=Trichinella pseudospiralis TaxID=6337 RepID=A0A0V1FRT1_TRIPS|nr:PiggyBac transposable element-derived protein 3 [Trichinella pseudospiralis]
MKGGNLVVDGGAIEQFFGILLFSGYHCVPSENTFWSTAEDMQVPLVSGSVYDDLNNRLRQFGVFHEKLFIDEGMVPYYGHHSCKMFIRGKPIRFFYKIWTLSSANGYPYALKIYAGRDEREKSEPLGMKIIEEMISVLERPEEHELYFNNFFASYNLLEKLSGRMIRATGTMRNSRTRKIPRMPVDEVKKKHRGFFDHVCNGTVNVVDGTTTPLSLWFLIT